MTLAESAARLTADQQTQLASQLATTGALSSAMVRDVAHGQTAHAVDALPDTVFTEQHAAWQTTVVGHLQAASSAVPETCSSALGQAISAALALVVRV